jgi:hypothetical protein
MKETEAENIYNKIVKEVIVPLTGNGSTFMSELNGIGKKLLSVKFKGVFPSDRIPKLNDLAPYCILNLDRSNQPGSHWIAMAKHGDNCILFDSFGRPYKDIIPNIRFSGNGRIFDTDYDANQDVKEENCGAKSLAFLLFFDKYGFDDAMLI